MQKGIYLVLHSVVLRTLLLAPIDKYQYFLMPQSQIPWTSLLTLKQENTIIV